MKLVTLLALVAASLVFAGGCSGESAGDKKLESVAPIVDHPNKVQAPPGFKQPVTPPPTIAPPGGGTNK